MMFDVSGYPPECRDPKLSIFVAEMLRKPKDQPPVHFIDHRAMKCWHCCKPLDELVLDNSGCTPYKD